ncbi:hypothetical protein KIN20_029448 [Parelaphostrongylus tenuis]|uniref:Uncharacterized protein n=1 Tax=Parelaphostrongylus tenuis TaxID=148309 RepID=A0AAD5R2N0_PARTN|nr:hypothetical protein KIN20_029448 [Parelaphostrongylus tenuis]
MAYSSEVGVRARFPGIAADMSEAQAFVSRFVMQTIFDVLERQARSALLPDAVISAILSQLEVRIAYEATAVQDSCQSRGNVVICRYSGRDERELHHSRQQTVTGICTTTNMRKMCKAGEQTVTITDVPTKHLTISGTLSTTNIVMANWSSAMWQNVVNRAIRTLATGPLSSHFFSATATAS